MFLYIKICTEVLQFNTFQTKTRLLWDICLQNNSLVNDLKTFYIDIKNIEHVKKQIMLQKRMEDFSAK